eukprot:symbB.v1.2.001051.t1/scaffold33.1/size517934/3
MDAIFLSPPWANEGIIPAELQFTMRRLGQNLDATQLVLDALRVAPQAAIFLPRVALVVGVTAIEEVTHGGRGGGGPFGRR